jgi:hypothetical protein
MESDQRLRVGRRDAPRPRRALLPPNPTGRRRFRYAQGSHEYGQVCRNGIFGMDSGMTSPLRPFPRSPFSPSQSLTPHTNTLLHPVSLRSIFLTIRGWSIVEWPAQPAAFVRVSAARRHDAGSSAMSIDDQRFTLDFWGKTRVARRTDGRKMTQEEVTSGGNNGVC